MVDIVEHLPFLMKACIKTRPHAVLELGVREGTSTRAFLAAAEVLDFKLVSIDIDDCSKVSDSTHWEFHQMNDLDYEPGAKSFKVLFIDTSHTYEQTLAELTKFAPYVPGGGIIILHDTTDQRVFWAIVDFLKNHKDEYLFENRVNCNGLGILWKRP